MLQRQQEEEEIALESARVGAQKDSQIHHMLTDTGMKMTMNQKTSTASDRAAMLAGHKIQSCISGWI